MTSNDDQRAAAVAQLDQVQAEMADMLNVIVGRVRTDIDAGRDRAIIFAQLVVNAVNHLGVPREGPGAYLFALAILRLATAPAPDDGVSDV